MQRTTSGYRLTGMNPTLPGPDRTPTARRRGRRGLPAGVLVVLACLLVACAGVAGTASPQPASTSAGPTTPTGIDRNPPVDQTVITRSSSAPTLGPPDCVETPNKLATPTGKPMITVSWGANSWIANWAVEPLALAVYADGTVIRSLGAGESNKPLPEMTLGYLPSCRLDWARREIQELSALDMGDSGISDQGTTTLTYQPETGAPVAIAVYALGAGDQYVMSGKANRARFSSLLSELHAGLDGAAGWTPTRLRVVSVPTPVAGDDDPVWPSAIPLDRLLVDQRGSSRCGVVTGKAAQQVLAALGSHSVYSRWIVSGKPVGLNIGALVPGQDGCTGG